MSRKTDSLEGRGGYPAGDKLVSELGPPPTGPGAGVKSRPSSESNGDPAPRKPESESGGPEKS
jgi:hypothetical protein